MCRQFQQLSYFTPVTDELEAFLVVDGGVEMIALPVSNEEGTFLACSDNPLARVVASLTALHETSLARSRVHAP